jgi:hypothetical protein
MCTHIRAWRDNINNNTTLDENTKPHSLWTFYFHYYYTVRARISIPANHRICLLRVLLNRLKIDFVLLPLFFARFVRTWCGAWHFSPLDPVRHCHKTSRWVHVIKRRVIFFSLFLFALAPLRCFSILSAKIKRANRILLSLRRGGKDQRLMVRVIILKLLSRPR